MTVEFLKPAEAELEAAVDWYNQQTPGVGEDFRAEVGRAIERILTFPDGWQKIARRTRRCRTRKFPYGVMYQVLADRIVIVAVAHLSRKPGYWDDRARD